MVDFANEIGREGFDRHVAGRWHTDQLNNRLTYTTEELLKQFDNTRIPKTVE